MLYLKLQSSLTTAVNGQSLAGLIIAALHTEEAVQVDFADVEVLTPSFANALILTLLASMSVESLRVRCVMTNRRDTVADSLNRAAFRFQQGIRLSDQLPAHV
ncbi:MAG: STAS-like domain-containing protein [Phycisphaeraceae bacterium]|nr:STAS-like domain-containing protein [Phycisphaeraceae bacterium]